MNAQLNNEITNKLKDILSTIKLQNKVIGELILKESSMKVLRCTGNPEKPKFDLRSLNRHLLR